MINRTITFIGAFLFICCVGEQDRIISDLEEYFTKDEVLQLQTERYLSIRFLEVNERGDLLVTGRRGKVLLFNGEGELIRDLGAHAGEEHPGLNWSPTRAVFLQDGSIFVQNNAPWGLYFYENGNFEKAAPSDFHVSSRFTAGADNLFYSMEITPAGTYIRKLNADGDEVGRFDDVPESFINLMQRYRVGNQFVADDQFLFFTMVADPGLFRLHFEDGKLDRFEDQPDYFTRLDSDISTLQRVGTAGLAEEIVNFSENHTVSYSLHQITDQLLIMQFQNRPDILEGKAGFGIQMVTTTGEFPMARDLLTDEWLMTATNGTIYTSERQEDAYAEPVINVYRLKESFIDKLEAEKNPLT